MNNFYSVSETPALKGLLQQADELKSQIDQKRPLSPGIWATIQQKLKIDWTYDSNAIEGSTLTRGETAFFLQEGLTVEGKPLKDFLDARNHAEAIDWLYQVIKENRPLSEGLIKEINALLMLGQRHTPAIDQFGNKTSKPLTAGQYKLLPNHVLQADGTIHYYTEPLQVPGEMQALCQWLNAHLNIQHPVMTGAVGHYNMARIHPFDDGNGRGARILMNLVLMKQGYPPAIIRMEQRRAYLGSLAAADRGNINPFFELVAGALIQTENTILSDLG